MQINVS